MSGFYRPSPWADSIINYRGVGGTNLYSKFIQDIKEAVFSMTWCTIIGESGCDLLAAAVIRLYTKMNYACTIYISIED